MNGDVTLLSTLVCCHNYFFSSFSLYFLKICSKRRRVEVARPVAPLWAVVVQKIPRPLWSRSNFFSQTTKLIGVSFSFSFSYFFLPILRFQTQKSRMGTPMRPVSSPTCPDGHFEAPLTGLMKVRGFDLKTFDKEVVKAMNE